MKNNNLTKIELAGYSLIILLAAFLRLFNLNQLPLTIAEAGWALPVWQVLIGDSTQLGPNPAYAALSSFLLFIFGDSNGAARLAGAMVGTSLVLAPYFLRGLWGKSFALILALGLALDPILIAGARLSGGPALGMGFAVWTMVAFTRRQSISTGILLGLFILSGTDFLVGSLILGLALVAWLFLVRKGVRRSLAEQLMSGMDRRQLIFSLLITLFVGSMAFTLLPAGIGAAANSIPAFGARWITSSGVSIGQLLSAILIYQPVALIFGLAHIVRTIRFQQKESYFFVIWAITALILIIFMPDRQIVDLGWFLLPLWTLAAFELAPVFSSRREALLPVLTGGVLAFILIIISWLNLAGYLVDNQVARLYLTLGLIAIGVAAFVLIAMGSTWETSVQGLVWGSTAAFCLFILGQAFGISRTPMSFTTELWRAPPTISAVNQVLDTIGDISEQNTGRRDSIDISVLRADSTLQWVLRRYPNAQFFADGIRSDSLPSILITPQDHPDPELALAYRGQDFVWQITPDWQSMFPVDYLKWLFYRQTPVVSTQITVWVRSDMFPGGDVLSQEQPSVPDVVQDELPEDSPMR
jgi:hypothetical protein